MLNVATQNNVLVWFFEGATPLHRASASGHKEIVVLLLKCGTLNINAIDTSIDDGTALHKAAREGHLGVVCLLSSLCYYGALHYHVHSFTFNILFTLFGAS